MNGRSNDSTAINAKNNEIIASFPIGEKPENCVVDGAGKLYVNIENSSEVVEIDAAKPGVTRRASLAPCEGPSGLAIDVKNKKLFSVCSNKMMAVTDIATMKVIATPADRLRHRWRGLRFRPGLQFQRRRRHHDHRQTGQRQVRSRGHRDHRARRPHHDGGPNHAPHLYAGRRIRPRRRKPRKAKEGPPDGGTRQLPRHRNRKVFDS